MSTSIAAKSATPAHQIQWQPAPPLSAGPEMAALKPFHSNSVWSGSVAANGMGLGSPEMMATGNIADDQFIVETLPDAPGQLRLTWTLAGPGEVQWRNACAVNGGPWFLVEEDLCTNV